MRDLLVGAEVVAGAHPAQPREEPPLLTSVCLVIHSSASPITHSTRLAVSCVRRCWPPTNPKAAPDLRAALAARDRYSVPGLPPPAPPAASG
jgi:hypothetical protein